MKSVALLRGINVGGHKKILMADLRALCSTLALGNVTTYIQTGNVVFETGDRSESEIVELLEKAIREAYGFDVPVVVRSHVELGSAEDDAPVRPADVAAEGTRYVIFFLDRVPAEGGLDDLRRFASPSERLELRGRELYLHCPEAYGRSKLSNDLVESKLAVRSTSRNWKTLVKLRELTSSTVTET